MVFTKDDLVLIEEQANVFRICNYTIEYIFFYPEPTFYTTTAFTKKNKITTFSKLLKRHTMRSKCDSKTYN